jgi:hypothetical protein
LIPARLLLPGRYSINLTLHTPKTHLYDRRKQALCFTIIATAGDQYDGFTGDELGHVHADVKWQRTDEEPSPVSARDVATALAATDSSSS